MSRSPTGHGFWMPASIADDTWPGVLATTLRSETADAPYAPGNRGLCRKSKCLNRQEFVVVGWTDPGVPPPRKTSTADSRIIHLRGREVQPPF